MKTTVRIEGSKDSFIEKTIEYETMEEFQTKNLEWQLSEEVQRWKTDAFGTNGFYIEAT